MSSIDDYIEAHSTPEDDYLYRLWRATNIHIARPHMVSGHVEGLLLKLIVEMLRPQNVLEIGTFTGYSAIAMSYGLKSGAMVHTFDVNDELETFTRQWIEGSPRAASISYTIGDVLSVLPQYVKRNGGITFDLAFIDGNKRQYAEYYTLVKRHMSRGGFIMADNTLWDGHVIDSEYDRDSQTKGIREFNELVAADSTVEKVVIPVRDGITLIHLKDDSGCNEPRKANIPS